MPQPLSACSLAGSPIVHVTLVTCSIAKARICSASLGHPVIIVINSMQNNFQSFQAWLEAKQSPEHGNFGGCQHPLADPQLI